MSRGSGVNSSGRRCVPASKAVEIGEMEERPMRRKDREISEQDARQLLAQGEYGVLSTVSPDGTPYGVPISYVYHQGEISFTPPPKAAKVEYLAAGARASFCVVGATELLPEKFSTRYESAIASGEIRELAGDEKRAALSQVSGKVRPGISPARRSLHRPSRRHDARLRPMRAAPYRKTAALNFWESHVATSAVVSRCGIPLCAFPHASSLPFRVVSHAGDVDHHDGFVADHPGVVSRSGSHRFRPGRIRTRCHRPWRCAAARKYEDSGVVLRSFASAQSVSRK